MRFAALAACRMTRFAERESSHHLSPRTADRLRRNREDRLRSRSHSVSAHAAACADRARDRRGPRRVLEADDQAWVLAIFLQESLIRLFAYSLIRAQRPRHRA